jgi:hypothetical protein
MAWLAKLLAEARAADIDVRVVQAFLILSELGLLLWLAAGLIGPDFQIGYF